MLAALLAEDGVEEICSIASRIGVMALHGGLEEGTWEAAMQCVDRLGASMYAVVQPDHLRWHIPSVAYAPTASRCFEQFLVHIDLAVSFHGYGRRGLEETVLVGGSNREVAAAVGAAIADTGAAAVIADPTKIPRGLRGLHPANPVNLPSRGGVQLELPSGVRNGARLASIADATAEVFAAYGGVEPRSV